MMENLYHWRGPVSGAVVIEAVIIIGLGFL